MPPQASAVKRPYKFVHVVRDPVKQIVSALLYEIQRIGGPDHDKYHKIVRSVVCEGIDNCSSTVRGRGVAFGVRVRLLRPRFFFSF